MFLKWKMGQWTRDVASINWAIGLRVGILILHEKKKTIARKKMNAWSFPRITAFVGNRHTFLYAVSVPLAIGHITVTSQLLFLASVTGYSRNWDHWQTFACHGTSTRTACFYVLLLVKFLRSERYFVGPLASRSVLLESLNNYYYI